MSTADNEGILSKIVEEFIARHDLGEVASLDDFIAEQPEALRADVRERCESILKRPFCPALWLMLLWKFRSAHTPLLSIPITAMTVASIVIGWRFLEMTPRLKKRSENSYWSLKISRNILMQ